MSQNELEIMKKELLDICFIEEKGIQLEYLDQSDPLVKKIKA